MSFTGKYTSSYDIIERVHREGFSDFTEEEAHEWIYECVSLMGISYNYVDKVAVLPIEDARASLPYDLYDLTEGAIRDYRTKMPLSKELDVFYNSDSVGNGVEPVLFQTTGESVVYIDGVPQENQDAYLETLTYYDYNAETYTYKINNGFIYTGFKSGAIELAYKAFPIDSNGNPLIEDNFKTVRAIVSFIMRKIAKRMFLRDEISLQKYEIIKQESMFHMSSAKSDANIGSVNDWEAIKDRLMRLRRDTNLSKIGFKGYSNREGINLG